MKGKFQQNFNTISNLLILSILLFGGVIWADSNGVWQRAEDIRAGIFGGDEGGGEFTFNTTLNLNNSVYYYGNELNSTFVNSNGDTIYGNLNVTGNVTMNNQQVATQNYVNNYVSTTVSGSLLWNQSGTDIYYDAGNVGISTNSPAQTLDVNGNIKAQQFCDNTGCYNISDFLSGGGSNVKYLSGNANHGDIVPIPSGFTRDQCDWIVSLRASSGGVPTDNHNVVYDIRADPTSGAITCRFRETAHGYFNNACSVNYLTVCEYNTTSGGSGGGTPSIDIYQCPSKTSCDDGQVVSGDWASFGCNGQISSISTCSNRWWNSGSRSCTNACTYLGKVMIQ